MDLPSWYRNVLQAGDRVAAHRVFFVVGCQKSGTTWVQHLLDAHPQIACGGEAHLTDVLAPALQDALHLYNQTPKTNQALGNDELYAAIRLVADRLLCSYLDDADNKQVLALGDKTPEAAMAIPALATLYPDARFVHIIRDGRDGAVSGWAHLKRLDQTDQFATFADYAGYFAENHWRGYIQAVRDAERALPGRVLEVRYEALHTEPESELRRVLALLGVSQDSDTISRCVEAASFDVQSGGRARGQELAESHFRKGIVGDWRNTFDDEAERRFEAAAGDLLRELGYSRAAKLRPTPA